MYTCDDKKVFANGVQVLQEHITSDNILSPVKISSLKASYHFMPLSVYGLFIISPLNMLICFHTFRMTILIFLESEKSVCTI